MRIKFFIIIASLFMAIAPAKAEVVATFYSHDFDGAYFPHAFVRFQGTVESTGQKVDISHGFTAKNLSPRILFGSVKGIVQTPKPKYISKSKAHFSVMLSNAQYAQLQKFLEKWRNIPGKSYNLGKRNCVHFTMEAAALFGLKVNRKSKYFKKPKSFLLELQKLNPTVKLIQSKT